MKPKLLIEDDGRRDKGAGEGKTKLGKEEDLEDLSKYISSNLIEEKKLKKYKRKNIKKIIESLCRKWDNNELSDLKFPKQISYIYINY